MVNGSADLLGVDLSVSTEEVIVFNGYIKKNYGALNEAVTEALKLLAETEGIFLESVYEGKAMA